MFAPDRGAAAAAELLRVVKPGGLAVMTGWVPEGVQARAAAVLCRRVPRLPAADEPVGQPGGPARAHFEDARAANVEIEPRDPALGVRRARRWLEFMEQGSGPIVAATEQIGE